MFSKTIQNIRQYYGGIHKFITIGSGNTQSPLSTLNDSSIETMVLYNGNVGVGTNIPTQKLDVRGNIVCSNISVIGDFVTLNTLTSNTEQIVIENAGTGPALKVTQTGNNSVAEFYDKESGVALFVGNGGYVGVGTTMPIGKLDVNGDIYAYGSIINKSIANDTNSSITTNNGAFLSIEAFNQTNTVKRPVVLSAYGGNVGIGNTNPQEKLDVIGNIKCNGYMFYPNSIIQTILMRYTPSGHISTTSTSFVDAAETISITPKFSNSKIRIEFNSEMAHINSASGVMYGNLQRKIGNGSYTTITGGSYNWFYRDGYFWAPMTNVMIDTPNTTDTVTYKGQIRVNNSSYTGYWVHQNQGYCWTLQEIKQ